MPPHISVLDTTLRNGAQPEGISFCAKVRARIIDEQAATAADTRVLIDANDGQRSWTTIGCSVNTLEASFQALIDSLELALVRRTSA